MLSQYLCTRERDGEMVLFHALHPVPIYCSTDEWKRFSGSKTGGLDQLVAALQDQGLLVASADEDRQAFARAEETLFAKLDRPTILYLMTAQGCNFKCGYCMVPDMAEKHGATLLSNEAARAGIDLWLEHVHTMGDDGQEYYVIFYGGEPLLNKEVIVDSLEYLAELNDMGLLPGRTRYMVATNGSMIDDQFVSLCKQYQVSVAVGLDGPQLVNDTLKVDLFGHSTYERIVRAIKLLVAANIPTFISCSVTPFNIDQADQFGNFFRKLGVSKFGFNFLKGQKLVDLVGKDGVTAYYRKAAQVVMRQYQQDAEPGFEYQMEKKLEAFTRGKFFPVDCTCYGNQLVIQPDGQISNCPFYKAMLGDVQTTGRDFRIADQSIVHAWRKRLSLYQQSDAKALCGGGCVWGLNDQGQDTAGDIGSLIFAEEVLNEFIWNKP